MTPQDDAILIVTPSRVYRYPPLAITGPTPHDGLWRALRVGEVFAWATEDGRVGLVDGQDDQQQDLGEEVSSLLLLSPERTELLIGTSAPHIYRLDRTGHLERNEAFDALPQRDAWFTPWGGPPHVRSMAATPDGWVYADIEVGSIMVSPDRGESWQPVDPGVHPDVHQVTTVSAAPDRVYANTQKSVFLSEDRGRSWRDCGEDLGHRYGRAIAVCGDDPDRILATVSDGPHDRQQDVHGQLYLSEDAGRSWRHIADGFPASTPKNINTYHVAWSRDGRAWACVGPRVYVSDDGGRTWQQAVELPQRVVMLSPITP